MTIKEQVAYLQGLAEGLNIGNTDEGKLITAIIDTLDSVADEIADLNENALDIGEELDAISDDLADVEDFLEELELDDEDFDFDYDDDDDWDYDDEDDDWDDDEDDEEFDGDFKDCNRCGGNVEFSINVNCPECNAELELDEKDIASELVTCPACGKEIELEIEEVDVDLDDEDAGGSEGGEAPENTQADSGSTWGS